MVDRQFGRIRMVTLPRALILASGVVQEHVMRKVLRGYAKVKDGNLILIGTIPVPHSKYKPSPRERENRRHLVRQGATIFKKELVN